MNRIYIDTLGCAKNEYDSQMLAAEFIERGCDIVNNPDDADVIIVNTCGFIDDAKRESISRIFELADIKENRLLVVTGCLSQRYHDELVKEMPEVDMFFGVNEYEKIPDIIVNKLCSTSEADIPADEVSTELDDLKYRKRNLAGLTHTAVLKIAEGCNNACSFCAIPSIRGHYRSKKLEDCLAEARDLAEFGIKELVLIAQDTSQYGKDLYGTVKLPELLRQLCRIDGIEWIRLMYVYDNGITDELIETIKNEDKICNYLDIPIQHISDNVLNRMKRQSSGRSIKETIKKLRADIPDIHIRTTLLVGFPGESEDDFKQLVDFIDETHIDRLGAFAFSDEEGTASYNLDGKLDEETKELRRNTVMEHQLLVSEELNLRKINRVLEVIIDEYVEDGIYLGRSRYDAPEIDCEVTIRTSVPHNIGDIIKVKINEAYEYDLDGEEIL